MVKSVTLDIATIICLIALLAVDWMAFAQAGSTGGTIGKTDKSVSGGEEAKPRSERKELHRSAANKEPTGGTCEKFVGTWSWLYPSPGGHSEVVISQDGSGRTEGGLTSNWTCSHGPITAITESAYKNGSAEISMR
jgi:hypothetical protein